MPIARRAGGRFTLAVGCGVEIRIPIRGGDTSAGPESGAWGTTAPGACLALLVGEWLSANGATWAGGLRQDQAVTTRSPSDLTSPTPSSPAAAPARATLTPVSLSGRYVRLEPLTVDHVEDLAKAAAPDRATFGLTTVPDGTEGAQRYVEAALARQATGRELPFAVRRLTDDQIVGSTRFLDLDVFTWPAPSPAVSGIGPLPADETPPTVAEIGATWYAASAQRSAVNTEAKLLLLTHAFEVWSALRVSFKTDARNQASRRAIERLGAQFEGIRRAHVPATDGTVRDSAYYSILQAEWPPLRDRLIARLAR
jgi:N-acetyltransferase